MLKGEEEGRNIKYREKILRESGSEKRDDRYRKFKENESVICKKSGEIRGKCLE